jgi:PRTRC genetic system ThiF family protein
MSHHISHLITTPAGETITISVIGAGGTGSILLGTLARLNQAILRLKRIHLRVRVFDPDRITDNNIARQNFSLSDIGMFKSRVITERLNRFYNTQWLGFPYTWEEDPDRVRANIIITCIDTAASRIRLSKKLSKWSETSDHPSRFCYWLDCGNGATNFNVLLGGYGQHSTQITPEEFVAGNKSDWEERVTRESRLPFVTELYDLRKHEKRNPSPSCSLTESLTQQSILVNDMCSKVACLLLWDLMTLEWLTWRGCFGNLTTLNFKKIPC